MKTKMLISALAASSMALAQPALAATRSADSLPANGVQTTPSADRMGSITGETDASCRKRTPILLIILLFGSIAAFVALITGHKSNG